MTTTVARLLLGPLIAAAAGASIDTARAATDSAAAPQQFYVEDIKDTMLTYIAQQVDADGVFHLRDDKTGEALELKFVKIHDPVRQIDGDTYFACTDFHVLGEPEKVYDLDF